ncbi:MAG: tRNA 2-thiouridine(34) synthase MnmA [Bradymonadales bacterium]|nr:tRNA 2-thiouridine(34) synthase MnmA [Bradymonadales bacterium]
MRVAVAISGGVDSSVAAALLAQEGHQVVGVHMIIAGRELSGSTQVPAGDSPGVEQARAVAGVLSIPLHIVDLREVFRAKVLAPFVSEYGKGRTPSPCLLCNRWVKFGALLQTARDLGADRFATGHYARIDQTDPARPRLLRGVDREKDQSYFLGFIQREALAWLRFPLGERTKREVRALARDLGLPSADRGDSHDLCFLGGFHYREVVGDRLEESQRHPGPFVHARTGEILGRHQGVHLYTVGQRRGLQIGGQGEPLYVVDLDADTGTVLVGPRKALFSSECSLIGCQWPGEEAEAGPLEVEVQIRYRHLAVPARLEPTGLTTARVVFATPQAAVTPGQAAVFYQDEEVLGGGWIDTRTRR